MSDEEHFEGNHFFPKSLIFLYQLRKMKGKILAFCQTLFGLVVNVAMLHSTCPKEGFIFAGEILFLIFFHLRKLSSVDIFREGLSDFVFRNLEDNFQEVLFPKTFSFGHWGKISDFLVIFCWQRCPTCNLCVIGTLHGN